MVAEEGGLSCPLSSRVLETLKARATPLLRSLVTPFEREMSREESDCVPEHKSGRHDEHGRSDAGKEQTCSRDKHKSSDKLSEKLHNAEEKLHTAEKIAAGAGLLGLAGTVLAAQNHKDHGHSVSGHLHMPGSHHAHVSDSHSRSTPIDNSACDCPLPHFSSDVCEKTKKDTEPHSFPLHHRNGSHSDKEKNTNKRAPFQTRSPLKKVTGVLGVGAGVLEAERLIHDHKHHEEARGSDSNKHHLIGLHHHDKEDHEDDARSPSTDKCTPVSNQCPADTATPKHHKIFHHKGQHRGRLKETLVAAAGAAAGAQVLHEIAQKVSEHHKSPDRSYRRRPGRHKSGEHHHLFGEHNEPTKGSCDRPCGDRFAEERFEGKKCAEGQPMSGERCCSHHEKKEHHNGLLKSTAVATGAGLATAVISKVRRKKNQDRSTSSRKFLRGRVSESACLNKCKEASAPLSLTAVATCGGLHRHSRHSTPSPTSGRHHRSVSHRHDHKGAVAEAAVMTAGTLAALETARHLTRSHSPSVREHLTPAHARHRSNTLLTHGEVFELLKGVASPVTCEDVKALEQRMKQAIELQKEMEEKIDEDRRALEGIEETLLAITREENRLGWRAEEMEKRSHTLEALHHHRGEESLQHLRNEANRLRTLIAEIERKVAHEEHEEKKRTAEEFGVFKQHSAREKEVIAIALVSMVHCSPFYSLIADKIARGKRAPSIESQGDEGEGIRRSPAPGHSPRRAPQPDGQTRKKQDALGSLRLPSLSGNRASKTKSSWCSGIGSSGHCSCWSDYYSQGSPYSHSSKNIRREPL